PFGYRDGGHAWRGAEALLAAGVRIVDAPLLWRELDPAERGHTVDEQKCVMVAQRGAKLGYGMTGAGRGLRMHDADEAGIGMTPHGVEDLVVGHDVPVIGPDLDDVGAVTLGRLHDPVAEEPTGRDDHRLTRVDERHQPGLHTGGAWEGGRDHQSVLLAVNGAEHVDELGEHSVEVGIEVAVH